MNAFVDYLNSMHNIKGDGLGALLNARSKALIRRTVMCLGGWARLLRMAYGLATTKHISLRATQEMARRAFSSRFCVSWA